MLHKTRVAIRFRAKKPFTTDYPKFCVGLPVVMAVGRRCMVTWFPHFSYPRCSAVINMKIIYYYYYYYYYYYLLLFWWLLTLTCYPSTWGWQWRMQYNGCKGWRRWFWSKAFMSFDLKSPNITNLSKIRLPPVCYELCRSTDAFLSFLLSLLKSDHNDFIFPPFNCWIMHDITFERFVFKWIF